MRIMVQIADCELSRRRRCFTEYKSASCTLIQLIRHTSMPVWQGVLYYHSGFEVRSCLPTKCCNIPPVRFDQSDRQKLFTMETMLPHTKLSPTAAGKPPSNQWRSNYTYQRSYSDGCCSCMTGRRRVILPKIQSVPHFLP